MSTPDSPITTEPIDLHKVLLEIEEEVRAKRATGELAGDVEKELDTIFARLAPPGAVEGDFGALVQLAEQQSFIDLLAPNASVRKGVPQIKRVVQKTVRWYLRYVAEQIGAFANTTIRALRMLGDRVEYLEQMAPPTDGVDAVLRALSEHAKPWSNRIIDAFQGVEGRVLHARCGNGDLVHALNQTGFDAYGVDASADFVASGAATGLDLRPDDERQHLKSLSPGVLDGLLLTGVLDVLAPGTQVELLDLAALALKKGGTVVLLITNPAVWNRLAGVPTDLAPGHPMRPETWQHLLHDRGFTNIVIGERAADGLMEVPGGDEAAAAMNANIARLNQALFPSESFLITAVR